MTGNVCLSQNHLSRKQSTEDKWCINLVFINLVNRTNLAQNFLNMFIALLYMFRATVCPSSGEITLSMRHLLFVTVYGWLSGMQGGIPLCIADSHPYSDKYQVSHRYGNFSWWWAHSCPKHVQKSNKHIKKIVHQVGSVYKIIQGCAVNKTQKLTKHAYLQNITTKSNFMPISKSKMQKHITM